MFKVDDVNVIGQWTIGDVCIDPFVFLITYKVKVVFCFFILDNIQNGSEEVNYGPKQQYVHTNQRQLLLHLLRL